MKSLWVVAAALRHGHQIFTAERKAGGASDLKWEFPGGKVEAGESVPKALQREIFEVLGISVEVGPSIGTFTTALDKYLIQLECHWCTSEDRDAMLTCQAGSSPCWQRCAKMPKRKGWPAWPRKRVCLKKAYTAPCR